MSFEESFTAGDAIIFLGTTIFTVFGLKFLMEILMENEGNNRTSSSSTLPEESEEECLDLAGLEERKPGNLWNTAMFFPDYCASDMDSTTQQFLWYFSQARTSIRVCIYNFSFPELEYVLKQQFDKGLIVQFVVGIEAAAETLRAHSIPCGLVPRKEDMPSTDQLMHHKFALIDDEAVLVGSMNWTVEGVVTNKENVCVSTNRNHVKKYLEEFFRLQKICEDAKTFY